MRTKYLLAFSIATAALFLPCAAQAQSCEQGPCETWAVFDPNSGTISGGSYYENFDYSDWVMVESYIWDPSYNYTYLGSAVDYEYAEFDFSYTPQMSGMYTIVGYNSYEIEDDGWTPDGESDCSVDATGSPAPVGRRGSSVRTRSRAMGSTFRASRRRNCTSCRGGTMESGFCNPTL